MVGQAGPHVPIFVYVIDDLERFGRSIGNTGKRNGVRILDIFIDCNTGILLLRVYGALFASFIVYFSLLVICL